MVESGICIEFMTPLIANLKHKKLNKVDKYLNTYNCWTVIYNVHNNENE